MSKPTRTEEPYSHVCPNCRSPVTLDAAGCANCGASFGQSGGWSPIPSGPEQESPPAVFYPSLVAAGLALLVGTFLPVGSYVAGTLLGGMHGPHFRLHPPAVYLALAYVLTYLPYFILASYLLHRNGVVRRVPSRYRSGGLFGLGAAVILLYCTARVLASMIPGGGAGFFVISLSPYFVWPAVAVLIVAAARFFIGIGIGKSSGQSESAP